MKLPSDEMILAWAEKNTIFDEIDKPVDKVVEAIKAMISEGELIYCIDTAGIYQIIPVTKH
jgi:hypothetical protein